MSDLYLTAPSISPCDGTIKSPAVLVAFAVQLLLSSLLLQAIFLGSPPDPNVTKCLSLVTMIDLLLIGALLNTADVVSGEPPEESGLQR